MKKATLILIQGRPATGKTILGRQIAEFLHIPFFSRDDYKEVIYDTFGKENDQTLLWSRNIGAVSFEILYKTIENLLISHTSCVVETAWTPAFAEPRLKEILSKTHANVIQIYLHCDPNIRKKRFEDRAKTTRHRAHMDILRIDSGEQTDHDMHPVLHIGHKVIHIDTTDVDFIDTHELTKKIIKELC